MGWLSDKLFGKKKSIDANKIKQMMAPTANLMGEQLGISRQLMDPNSSINMRMRNMMAQRAAEGGAQTAQQMQKMGAMGGMSPAQAMMQARMGMNQAMGGVDSQMLGMQQGQFSQGLGLMGQMTNLQKQLNEGDVNTYVGGINAANAARNQRMGMASGLLGSVVQGAMGMPPK